MNKYKVSSKDEFVELVRSEILTAVEVVEELEVSRQTLASLVKRGKLVPIKEVNRDRIFLRDDVLKRKAESEELFAKYRPYDE